MTPHDLLTAFETLADAPDGIERLRELVLQLAVRGRLVAQDPDDEPASRILERSARVRSRGRSRSAPLKPFEMPYEIPETWVWCTFAQIADCRLGKMLDKARNSGSQRRYLRNANLQWFRFDLADVKTLRLQDSELDKYSIRLGDLLICEGGEPGRCAVANADVAGMVFQKAVHRALPVAGVNSWYLAYLLRADTWSERLTALFTGATIKHLTGRSLAKHTVPLPPAAEQRRIVARVDELMGLLDRLEAARTKRDETRVALRNAALAALRDADDAEAVDVAWARVAEQMSDLFTEPDDVEPLRQTILQLAVRGRLVPQDPDDEPVSALLERIAAEKARLVKEKKIRRPRRMEPLVLEEMPFALPLGWSWAMTDDISCPDRLTTYGILKPVWVEAGVPTVRISEMRTGRIDIADLRHCSVERAAKFEKTRLFDGDLLISKDGTIGVTAIVPPDLEGGNITQHVLRLSVHSSVYNKYIRMAIDSPVAQAWMKGETKGVALKGVNVGDFRRMPLPIPPVSEQRRIVQKVDTLFSLCDDIEAQLSKADQAQRSFAAAAVHHIDT